MSSILVTLLGLAFVFAQPQASMAQANVTRFKPGQGSPAQISKVRSHLEKLYKDTLTIKDKEAAHAKAREISNAIFCLIELAGESVASKLVKETEIAVTSKDKETYKAYAEYDALLLGVRVQMPKKGEACKGLEL